MTYLLDEIDTTMDVIISDDPFDKIVGQEHAVRLVKTAVRQKRHVLLCGAPGTGKSMLAKASASLLPPPRQKILLEHDPANPDRPRVVVADVSENGLVVGLDRETRDCQYVRPENLPRDVAVNMGYRCPRCDAFSVPDLVCCQDCGTPKRHDWDTGLEYYRLFRTLNIVGERALREVTTRETDEDGNMQEVTYIRENGMGDYVKRLVLVRPARRHETEGRARILVNATAPRFVRVSGSSPVELLGDVKHDPYGGSEAHGTPAYLRVIPGAIHEAHEGILYVDEIATLGSYQKHLLTAMQDKRYPISGHNPESAGAAVRVDDVPCDFILFASCNPEDLPMILPPLRSRIRGYGYEIMLSSWFPKTPENVDSIVRFVANTVNEDGRIPHFSVEAVEEIIRIAEDLALRLDRQSNALTLRLRELGGYVRVSGDLAAQDGSDVVGMSHVKQAKELICEMSTVGTDRSHSVDNWQGCGSYFL